MRKLNFGNGGPAKSASSITGENSTGKRPTEEGEGRQADDSSGHRKARTRQLVGKNRRSQPKRKPTTGEEVPILTDICVYPTTRLPSGGTSPHEGEYERFYPKIPPYPTSHFRQGVKLSSYGGGGEERSPCREGYSRDYFSSRSRWEWNPILISVPSG